MLAPNRAGEQAIMLSPMLREYLLVLIVAPAVALAAGIGILAGIAALAGPGPVLSILAPVLTFLLAAAAGRFAGWRHEASGYALDPFLCIGTVSALFGSLAVLLAYHRPVLGGEAHLAIFAAAVVGPFIGARLRAGGKQE